MNIEKKEELIEELLKNPQILEEMATQIEGRVNIKSKEELIKEIMDSENPVLDDILGQYEQEDGTYYVVTKRDLLYGKLTGKEVPSDLESVFPGTYEGEMAEYQVYNRRRAYREAQKNNLLNAQKNDITKIARRQKEGIFRSFINWLKNKLRQNKENEISK